MTQDEATQLRRMIRTYAAEEANAEAAYAQDQESAAARYGKKAEAKLAEIDAFITSHTRD